MNNSISQEITTQNENYTRLWFEKNGFSSEQLDKRGKNDGKIADWKFTKETHAIICEVKTIFSGGQVGLTREQHERDQAEQKRAFEHAIAKAQQDGYSLIAPRDQIPYLKGEVPYQKHSIRRETEFKNFIAKLQTQMSSVSEISTLPFDLTISVDAMYIPYGDTYEQFLTWVKGFVLWMNENYTSVGFHSTSTFTFVPAKITDEGNLLRSIEAFVQIMGPFSGNQELRIGFTHGGGNYNEQAVEAEIRKGITQLRNSIQGNQTGISILALWSSSSYLIFRMLLIFDAINATEHNSPRRYHLFDWAFDEYRDLGAIILFELFSDGDIFNPSIDDNEYPYGYILTNPYLPDTEQKLKNLFSVDHSVIKGISK